MQRPTMTSWTDRALRATSDGQDVPTQSQEEGQDGRKIMQTWWHAVVSWARQAIAVSPPLSFYANTCQYCQILSVFCCLFVFSLLRPGNRPDNTLMPAFCGFGHALLPGSHAQTKMEEALRTFAESVNLEAALRPQKISKNENLPSKRIN